MTAALTPQSRVHCNFQHPGEIKAMKYATTIKLILFLITATLLSAGALPVASADPVHHTIVFKVAPEKSADFLAIMKEAAVDTRAFKGCEYFAILVDEKDPGNILFYEIWDSEDNHKAYQAWRNETKFGDRLSAFMIAPPTRNSYTLFDD